MVAHAHPDCINASNPYHECTDYCFQRISERKSQPSADAPQQPGADAFAELPTEFGRKAPPKRRRPDAVDSAVVEDEEEDEPAKGPINVFARPVDEDEPPSSTSGRRAREDDVDGEEDGQPEAGRIGADVKDAPTYENMSERQNKLFDLKMKLNQARKLNQTAVVAERTREQKATEEPQQTRGVSKAQWYEEKKKKMSKVLDANGLDMSRAYMLDTQEAAEQKYKKWEKKEAAFGWDVFNQKSLYNAYKKRAANIPVDMDEYEKQKEADPNFYRDNSCLEYGKAPEIPEENVERMAAELEARGAKRKEFSRRRRYHEEKDIDSINERNEHFNRKIERAFGKYTIEIKNNLERGTALPD